jgi:hypothetical protein
MLIVQLDQLAKNMEKSREENKTNRDKIYTFIVCEVNSRFKGTNLRFSIRSLWNYLNRGELFEYGKNQPISRPEIRE